MIQQAFLIVQKAPIIVWIRRDLRIGDNPALHAASQQECPVIPVFIWSPEESGPWPAGGASRWWVHHSLNKLAEALNHKGAQLIIRQGNSLDELSKIIALKGGKAE